MVLQTTKGGRIALSVDGLKETLDAMQILTKSVQKRITNNSLVEAAEPMARVARSLAPSDSGVLKEAIIVSTKADIRGRLRNKNLRFGFVGPSYSPTSAFYAPHAHLVEFGTAARYHKNGKFVGQAPAQPFMRPAFDLEKVGTVNRFRDIIIVEVEAARRKAIKKLKLKSIKASRSRRGLE